MAHDIEQLVAAEEGSVRDHHWRVTYEVFVPEVDDWVFEENTVAAGPDSRVAVQRLEERVNNPEEYGQIIKGFRALDVRLLSKADF